MQLGQILIRKKLISDHQLEQTIGEQISCPTKLGELLIKNHLIDTAQLEIALKEQYWRRNGFWLID